MTTYRVRHWRTVRDERRTIVSNAAADPKRGVEIQGSGGVGKFGVAGRGKGKSGGYRVAGRWLRGVFPVFAGLVVMALARPE
jgi:hypothetical protein